MRILHVGVGNLGPGGVATYLSAVVEGQRLDGAEVELVELWPGRQPGPHDPLPLASYSALVELAGERRPDIVHLHSLLPRYDSLGPGLVLTAHDHLAHCPSGGRYLSRSGRECTRKFGLAACLWGHYVDACGSRRPKGLRNRFRLVRAATDFPGRWVAPSAFSLERLSERGIPPDRLHLVPNPAPPAPPEARRTMPGREFLFVGRLLPNKGCGVALRAVSRVEGARLRILGDGPEKPLLESMAGALGVSDRVSFEGWLPKAEVDDRMGNCLALLVPSLWPEPFGLVVLEAFGKSRPVIASRTGGLTDLVDDGRNGRLFRAGDPDELAGAMRSFLEATPDMLHRMGREGARDAREKFSLRTHLAGLETVYGAARGA